jgi:hypothetical protein
MSTPPRATTPPLRIPSPNLQRPSRGGSPSSATVLIVKFEPGHIVTKETTISLPSLRPSTLEDVASRLSPPAGTRVQIIATREQDNKCTLLSPANHSDPISLYSKIIVQFLPISPETAHTSPWL